MFQEHHLSERSWGIFLAFSFHAALFIIGGMGLTQKIQYGMDFSNGAAEVDLVAAPAPSAAAIARIQAPQESVREIPPVADKEDVAQPMPAQTSQPAAAVPAANLKAILQTANLNGPLGDGSSPVAGTDATTLHRVGSSGSYFKAGYYRNPPPVYPAQARKLKQEGLVLLLVKVTTEGRAASVELKESSGFPLLDQAALKGVKFWRFRPASVGGFRVETLAEIPIRFQLNK